MIEYIAAYIPDTSYYVFITDKGIRYSLSVDGTVQGTSRDNLIDEITKGLIVDYSLKKRMREQNQRLLPSGNPKSRPLSWS